MRGKNFQPTEIQFILDNYKTIGCKAVAEQLGRTVGTVQFKARKLNLTQSLWSESDEQYLRDNYYSIAIPELVEKLGRTVSAIHNKASLMNLSRDRSIHNYLSGTPYNQPSPQTIVKREIKAATKKIKKPPPERKPLIKPLNTKPFDPSGKRSIRLDSRTLIYVDVLLPPSEVEKIIHRYSTLRK